MKKKRKYYNIIIFYRDEGPKKLVEGVDILTCVRLKRNELSENNNLKVIISK